jgi:hypothetical protein
VRSARGTDKQLGMAGSIICNGVLFVGRGLSPTCWDSTSGVKPNLRRTVSTPQNPIPSRSQLNHVELACLRKWIIAAGMLAFASACSTSRNQFQLNPRSGPPIESSTNYTDRVLHLNETWQLNAEVGLRVVAVSADIKKCALALVVRGQVRETRWYREGDYVDLDEALLGTHGFQLRSVKPAEIEVRRTHA